MRKIESLLDQHRKKLEKGSDSLQTEAGQTNSSKEIQKGINRVNETRGGGYGTSTERDRAPSDNTDAIGKIFAEFEFAYHNQFHKAFADDQSLVIAKKYWLSNLEHFSSAQIIHGGKQIIRTQDYLPSLATLVRACEQGLDLFGLPSARQAYLEACAAPSPKLEFNWSHEAVYHAGKASGWYLLANEPESRAFPIFDYHYGVLCQRVIGGETLDLDVPAALPEKIQRKLDKAETKARFAQLREELGL
jgi:hypothetical protein